MNIKKLEQKLYEAKIAYYRGRSIMSDVEYDTKESLLKEHCPDSFVLKMVGTDKINNKATHESFMGSLNNLNNDEEYKKWVNRIKKHNQYSFTASEKLDGLSIELIYKGGFLVSAITRGDGLVGENVLSNILKTSVPIEIDSSKFVNISIKGECVLFKENLDKINKQLDKKYKNCRNAAAGIIMRDDGKFSEYLDFIAYDFDSENDIPMKLYSHKLETLDDLGFKIPEYINLDDIDKLYEWILKYECFRDSIEYDIDGIVIRMNNPYAYRDLGITDGRPKGAMAYKFRPIKARAKIIDVIHQVGRTGAITPVAIIDPTMVSGSIIERATLHNYEEIARLKVAVGDTVEVVKAGDVIPKITKRIKKDIDRIKIKTPKFCPCCNKELTKDGVIIRCTEINCSERKLGRIKNWVKCRNIMNLNDGILEALYVVGSIENIADLYKLTFEQLAMLGLKNGILGEKRANKIFGELTKSSYNVDLAEFMGSLGIRMLGESNANKILIELRKDYNIETPEDFMDIKLCELFHLIDGIGNEIQSNIIEGFDNFENEIIELSKFMNFTKQVEGSLTGKTFCITGTLSKSRKEIEQDIKNKGGIIKGFSNIIDYLIVGEKAGSKLDKAQKANIAILTEEAFEKL